MESKDKKEQKMLENKEDAENNGKYSEGRSDIDRIAAPNEKLEYIKWIWLVVIIGIAIFYIFPNWSSSPIVFWGVNYPQLSAVIIALWFGDAFWVIPINKYGASTLFGKAVGTYDPGLKFLPGVLYRRYSFRSDVYELFWPSKLEEQFFGSDKETLPEGLKRRWRFLTGEPEAPKKSEGDKDSKTPKVDVTNILDVQQQVSISGFLTWRILRDKVFHFIIAAGGNVAETEDQIKGIVRGTLTSQVREYTVAKLNKHLGEIGLKLRKTLDKEMGYYGVEVDTSVINPIDFSKPLAEKQRDANVSRAEVIIAMNKTDQEAYDVKEVGFAKVDVQVAKIERLGEATRNAADRMDVHSSVLVAADVAEKTIGEGDTVVLGADNIGNVANGIAAGLFKKANATKSEKAGEQK